MSAIVAQWQSEQLEIEGSGFESHWVIGSLFFLRS